MSKFITFQTLTALPLHNLNRDGNGAPKSQIDGGVQRGRLSAQALKRAARVEFLTLRPAGSTRSIRTRDGVGVALELAATYAAEVGVDFDVKKGRAEIKKAVDSLAKGSKDTKEAKEPEKEAPKEGADDAALGDNVLLFSTAELQSLAEAVVSKQATGESIDRNADFIQDLVSPSLDIAAFGRMFAAAKDSGTQAAIAVSHAATTHQHHLTVDYFTAVDDAPTGGHAGAAHIGLAYYTSGTYHRSFTVDVEQLRRSWTGFDSATARDEVADLLRALVTALPSGRRNNTNPDTLPSLVLVEEQRSRCVYSFEEPVRPSEDGGYMGPSMDALTDQRSAALTFDPNNFGRALVSGTAVDSAQAERLAASHAPSLDALIAEVVAMVFDS